MVQVKGRMIKEEKTIKMGASYNKQTFSFHRLGWTCVQKYKNLIWKLQLGILS
jgi:hypothetical protein